MGTVILSRQQAETAATALRTASLEYRESASALVEAGDVGEMAHMISRALAAEALYERITEILER